MLVHLLQTSILDIIRVAHSSFIYHRSAQGNGLSTRLSFFPSINDQPVTLFHGNVLYSELE